MVTAPQNKVDAATVDHSSATPFTSIINSAVSHRRKLTGYTTTNRDKCLIGTQQANKRADGVTQIPCDHWQEIGAADQRCRRTFESHFGVSGKAAMD